MSIVMHVGSRWVTDVETTWDVTEQRIYLRDEGLRGISLTPRAARRLAMDLMHASANCLQGIEQKAAGPAPVMPRA